MWICTRDMNSLFGVRVQRNQNWHSVVLIHLSTFMIVHQGSYTFWQIHFHDFPWPVICDSWWKLFFLMKILMTKIFDNWLVIPGFPGLWELWYSHLMAYVCLLSTLTTQCFFVFVCLFFHFLKSTGFGHKVSARQQRYGDMKRKNENEKRKEIRERKMRRNVFVVSYLE